MGANKRTPVLATSFVHIVAIIMTIIMIIHIRSKYTAVGESTRCAIPLPMLKHTLSWGLLLLIDGR